MKHKLIAVAFVTVGVVTLMTGAASHDGATGIVKERMDLMSNLGKSMKELSNQMKSQKSFDPNKIKQILRQIQNHGGENLTKLFPSGTLDEPTTATEDIWKDWGKFRQLADSLVREAQKFDQFLPTLQQNPDINADVTMRQNFRRIARTCSNCHQDFRSKKK